MTFVGSSRPGAAPAGAGTIPARRPQTLLPTWHAPGRRDARWGESGRQRVCRGGCGAQREAPPPSRKNKKTSSFVERNTLKQAERKALCADARPCGARSSSRRDAWGRAWPSRRPPRRPASGARARSRCAPRRRMPRPRAAASSRSLPVSPPPRARACRRRRGQCARGTHGRLRLHARCQSCRRSCGVDRGRCVRVAWSAHLRGR